MLLGMRGQQMPSPRPSAPHLHIGAHLPLGRLRVSACLEGADGSTRACVLTRACWNLWKTLSAMAEAREEECDRVSNLVKSRTVVQGGQLHAAELIPSRLCLGRLSKSQDQQLHLVDCVCLEERIDEIVKDVQFHVCVVLILKLSKTQERS